MIILGLIATITVSVAMWYGLYVFMDTDPYKGSSGR